MGPIYTREGFHLILATLIYVVFGTQISVPFRN